MKENKLFKFFTPKSITKDDEFAEIPTNFKGFFVMLGRKFWNISNLSLLFTAANFPLLFVLLGVGLMDKQMVARGPMFSQSFGMYQISSSPELSNLFSTTSFFTTTSVLSTASIVCFAVAALFVLIFGLSSAGCAYIVRGYNKGEPVFLISDFFYTVKRNWKQALPMGILDLVFSFILVYDFLFWQGTPGFIGSIMMYFALFLCVVYLFMRFYIYTILITFDLSIFKILKDAFLLSFLGFKRNILALLGLIVVLYINLQLFFLLPSLGIMLPIVLTLGLSIFICGYASYPVIKKYMIDPFYPEESDNDEENYDSEDDDVVFEDRG